MMIRKFVTQILINEKEKITWNIITRLYCKDDFH